jgi:hypothetical protein
MDKKKLDHIVANARQSQEGRAQEYRQRALALFTHVCGRCGRSFERDTLHELTVHHRDHNHDNNPADGSNWELLCLYCHDNEHQRQLEADVTRNQTVGQKSPAATYRPFAAIDGILKDKD